MVIFNSYVKLPEGWAWTIFIDLVLSDYREAFLDVDSVGLDKMILSGELKLPRRFRITERRTTIDMTLGYSKMMMMMMMMIPNKLEAPLQAYFAEAV